MTPGISAILTTHNRAHLLPRVLEGLRAQTLPQSRFEIVVIDDGSSDDTRSVLSEYADLLPLRIFRQRPAGLAAAKNLGVFAALAPVVVFLDDDDVLDPEALGAHLGAHQKHPGPQVAVLGHTRLHAEVAGSPLMQYVTGEGGLLFSYGWLKAGQFYGYREFWGGRSSCKRGFLIEHGVFDPRFRFGYEDIECAWRLKPHGLRVLYEPAASAAMVRVIDFDGYCRRSYLQGRAAWTFARMHDVPEVQEYCNVGPSLTAWANDWLGFAEVLRSTRRLDARANEVIAGGSALPAQWQAHLADGYRTAFSLAFAKGMADGRWSTQVEAVRSPLEYGLPGGFDGLLARLTASGVSRIAA